jgi:hypothetical protein
LVNQVRNLGSKKWDDHEMVKVILRSLIFLNPTQVQLICGNPRYTLMTPEEVIGNFVSFEYMIKGSKKINELDDPSVKAHKAHILLPAYIYATVPKGAIISPNPG